MPRKRDSTEQIVTKLRQAEVELGRGLRTPQVCKNLGLPQLADNLFRAVPLRGHPASSLRPRS